MVDQVEEGGAQPLVASATSPVTVKVPSAQRVYFHLKPATGPARVTSIRVLPLDGGHIVMSILERIRGRAFSQLAYMRYSAVGLTLFAFLLYLGLRNDFSSGHS